MEINLRVDIPFINTVKTMAFKNNQKIKEIISIISEKLPDKIPPEEKKNYMLFLEDKEIKKKGCWLDLDRDLAFYNVKTGDTIFFKNKMAKMRVKMMDGSQKIFLMDQLMVVKDILGYLGEKLRIANIAEYSLCLGDDDSDSDDESDDESNKGLLHKKLEKREQKRIERMKKQLHTDDDLKWLVPEKRICDQGIDFESLFLLRRKYFLEANENISDPMEVNLLYNQCRDGILEGGILCSFEEACKFAAYQFQVENGNFNVEKYKNSNFDHKKYFPKEYQKFRLAKENMMKEHKTIREKDTIMAKHQYTKLCQNLKNYGVSLFLVKEKKEGKNKLTPILLGISKDNIIRMDDKTKEIVQKWPLTVIRRWAASKNSFSLDFGDFEDNTYSVLTPESERIAQLVSGYIELIINKKRNPGLQGYSNNANMVINDNVSKNRGVVRRRNRGSGTKVDGGFNCENMEVPYYFNSISVKYHSLIVLKKDGGLLNTAHEGMNPIGDYGKVYNLDDNFYNCNIIDNKAFTHEITEMQQSLAAINIIVVDSSPDIGDNINSDEKENVKQILKDHIALLSSSMAHLMEMKEKYTDPKYLVEIKQLQSTVDSMMDSIKDYSAYLNEVESNDLKNSCQDLMLSLRNFVGSIENKNNEVQVNVVEMRKHFNSLTSALNNIGNIAKLSETNTKLEEFIIKDGKYLTVELKAIVDQCRLVMSDQNIEKELRDAIYNCSKDVSEAAGNLITASKVLIPTYSNPHSRITIESFKSVLASKLNHLNNLCRMADTHSCEDLGLCCTNLLSALSNAFAAENISNDDTKIRKISVKLDQLLQEATVAEGLCSIKSPLAISESKLFLEQSHNLNELVSGYMFVCSNDDLRKGLEDFMKKTQNSLEGLLASINKEDLEETKTYIVNLKELAVNDLYNALKAHKFSNLENCAMDVVSSLNSLAISVDENKQLIYSKSSELDSAVNHFRKDRDCKILLASLVSSAQNTSEFCKSVLNEELECLEEYETKSMSALVYKKLNIVAVSVQNLDQSLKAATLKHTYSDTFDYLDKLQQACANMAKNLQKLAVGCDKIVQHKNNKLLYASCLNSFIKTYEKSRDLNQSLSHEDYTSYIENYHSIQNSICDVAGKCQYLVENKYLDKKSAVTLAKGIEKLVATSDDIKASLKSVLQNKTKENNNEILNKLETFDNTILSSASIIPNSKIVIAAIASFRALVKDLQSSYMKAEIHDKNDPNSDLFKHFKNEINTLCNYLMDFYSTVKDGCLSNEDTITNIMNKSKECRETGLKIANSLNPNARPHFTTSLTRILNGIIVSVMEPTSVIIDCDYPVDNVTLFDSVKNVVSSLRDLTSPLLNYVPGKKELNKLFIDTKFHCENSLLSASYPVTLDTNYWKCVDNIEKMKENFIGDITNSVPPCEPSKLSQKIEKIFSQLAHCIDQIVNETHQANFIRVTSDNTIKNEDFDLLIDSKIVKYLKDKLINVLNDINNNIQSRESIAPLIEEFEVYDQKIQQIIFKYFCDLNPIKSGTHSDDLKAAYGELINQSTQYRATMKGFLSSKSNEQLNKELDSGSTEYIDSLDKLVKASSNPKICAKYIKMDEKRKSIQKPILEKGQKFLQCSYNYAEDYKNFVSMLQASRNIDSKIIKDINCVIDALEELIISLKSNGPNNPQLTELIHTLENKHASITQFIVGVENKTDSLDLDEKEAFDIIDSMNASCNKFMEIVPPRKLSPNCIPSLEELVKNVCRVCDIVTLISTHMKDNEENQYSHKDRADLLNHLKDLLMNTIYIVDSINHHKQSIIYNKNPLAASTASANIGKISEELKSILSMCTNKYLKKQDSNKNLEKIIQRFEKFASNQSNRNNKAEGGSELQKPESIANEIISINKNMIKCSVKKVDEMPTLQCQAVASYDELCHSIEDLNINNGDLLKSIIRLGHTTRTMGDTVTKFKSNPTNMENKKEFATNSKNILDSATDVIDKLQSSKGIEVLFAKFCKELQSQMSDVEASILFAETGTLDITTSNSFNKNAEKVSKLSSEIIDLMVALQKAVIQGNETNTAINELYIKIDNLTKIINEAISSLGSENKDLQIELITNYYDYLKTLDTTLSDYKSENKNKFSMDQPITALKHNTNGFMSRVESQSNSQNALHNLNKYVMDRFNKIISSNCDNLKQQTKEKIEPEKLVRLSKNITETCQQLLKDYNSKKTLQYTEHCDKGKQNIDEFLDNIEYYLSQKKLEQEFLENYKDSVLDSLSNISKKFSMLLNSLSESLLSTDDSKLSVNSASRDVTQSLVKFLKVMSKIKGDAFVDPNDPNIQAEKELYSAAAKIEAAAKKLSELKPRHVSDSGQVNENLNFEEQIIEAATSITNAAKHLVAAATHAQRELVSSGVFFSSSSNSKEDGQWSQGLISAAQLVAQATHDLCEAANAAVKGEANEEKIIAAANSISHSTIQLIMACKVKADPFSEGQKRLQASGNAIKKATKALVTAVHNSGVFNREEDTVVAETQFVGSRKQEINMMEEILRKERELNEAREKLFKLRKQKHDN